MILKRFLCATSALALSCAYAFGAGSGTPYLGTTKTDTLVVTGTGSVGGNLNVTGSITGLTTGTGAGAAASMADRATDAGVTFNLRTYFGAKCDGVTDDTAAMQNWLNKAAPNVNLVAPAGTCLFSTILTAPTANNYAISGSGATIFKYTGASTSSPLINLGSATQTGVLPHDFAVTTATSTTGPLLAINGVAYTPPSAANRRIINVLDFGADPSGVNDSTAAINAAIAHGTYSNLANDGFHPKQCVYLPSGTYMVTNAITPSAQNGCFFGDGRMQSVLNVSSTTFNLSALGVIVLPNNSGGQSSEVYDIGVAFTQPDTSARGSLIAFPPGIYAQGAGRPKIHDIRIGGGSYCIDARGNDGGAFLSDIECGSLGKGLQMDGSLDGVHVDSWHEWNFGLQSTGLLSIYSDGTNECMELGRVDWLGANNIECYFANIVYTSNASGSQNVSTWSNVTMDGSLWQQTAGFNEVTNYTTTDGSANSGTGGGGSPWGPSVSVSGGTLNIDGYDISRHNSTTSGMINVSGGQLTMSGGQELKCNLSGFYCVVESGGSFFLSGSYINPTNGGAWTVPVVYQTGGVIGISGNWLRAGYAGGYTFADVTDDTGGSFILHNNMNGWVNTVPFSGTETQYGMNSSIGSLSSTTANLASVLTGTGHTAGSFYQVSGTSGFEIGQTGSESGNPLIVRDVSTGLDAAQVQPGGGIYLGLEGASSITQVNGSLSASTILNPSTTPSYTGSCLTHAPLGGQMAGSFESASSGGCSSTETVIMTFSATQVHGYECDAHDMNTPATFIDETATSATSATFTLSGAMAANDVVVWKCIGF